MRKPTPQEVRQQFRDLFISTGFILIGMVSAFLLYHSPRFAHLLATDVNSDRHLAVSLAIGVGVAALLVLGRIWTSARRRNGGGDGF
jgi:hypothetical protein